MIVVDPLNLNANVKTLVKDFIWNKQIFNVDLAGGDVGAFLWNVVRGYEFIGGDRRVMSYGHVIDSSWDLLSLLFWNLLGLGYT